MLLLDSKSDYGIIKEAIPILVFFSKIGFPQTMEGAIIGHIESAKMQQGAG